MALSVPERRKMAEIIEHERQNNPQAFITANIVTKGNKVYLVERHFAGNRDFIRAIHAAVENEARREPGITQAG